MSTHLYFIIIMKVLNHISLINLPLHTLITLSLTLFLLTHPPTDFYLHDYTPLFFPIFSPTAIVHQP